MTKTSRTVLHRVALVLAAFPILAYRILDHAVGFYETESSTLEKHFYLQTCIEVYYSGRSDPDSRLPDAIRACEDQIEIAPKAAKAFREEYPYDDDFPAHVGYKQLCIILHGDQPERAIALAREALAGEWAGDWERRIARMSKPNKAIQGADDQLPARAESKA